MKFLTAAGLEFILTFISHAINIPFYYYSLKVPRNDVIKDFIPQVTRQMTHCKTNIGYFDTDLGYFSSSKIPNCLASTCPPERPDTIGTRFLLSTVLHGEKYITWDDSSTLPMLTSHSVVIIVPGTFSSYSIDPWFNETRNQWLRLGSDVILVDWSAGNKEPLVSSANVQTVGAQIGQLALYLGFISKLNCVGVSSGAHACGFASQWLKHKTNQIIPKCTGIDPMGVTFNNCPSNYTLSKDDCGVVNIIHTSYNPTGVGLDKSSGHCDFWINYRTQFDDCNDHKTNNIKSIKNAIKQSKILTNDYGNKISTNILVNSLADSFKCSHKKAMKLYLNQLISYPNILYTARPCKSKFESCNLNDNLFNEKNNINLLTVKSNLPYYVTRDSIKEPLPPFDQCSNYDDQDFCLCLRQSNNNVNYLKQKNDQQFYKSNLIKTIPDVI